MATSNRLAWRTLTTLCLLIPPLQAAPEATPVLQPGPPVDYGAIAFNPKRWIELGIETKLVPWRGQHVVFLTTTDEFDRGVMTRLVSRLDGAWGLYAEVTGRQPRPLKQLDGLPTIAAIPDGRLSCGYGCGYIGATGVEVAGFYGHDYGVIKANPKSMPHYYFYEMGRNYYTFGPRHSLYITGFAVFMRYVCMDTLGCEDPDSRTRRIIEEAEAAYAAADIGFLKAFTTLDGLGEKAPRLQAANGKPLAPSDQPVMYATAMLKLWRDCGGNEWLKRFYQALARCDGIKPDTREAALRQSLNWLVAASVAAERDLSPIFADRWRMPLPPPAREILAATPWASSGLDPAAIVRSLPLAPVPAEGPAGKAR